MAVRALNPELMELVRVRGFDFRNPLRQHLEEINHLSNAVGRVLITVHRMFCGIQVPAEFVAERIENSAVLFSQQVLKGFPHMPHRLEIIAPVANHVDHSHQFPRFQFMQRSADVGARYPEVVADLVSI